jgi:hypothetical protein
MIGLLHFVPGIFVSPFKSKSRLEAENAMLRHQLIVLRRKMLGRPRLTNNDRWFWGAISQVEFDELKAKLLGGASGFERSVALKGRQVWILSMPDMIAMGRRLLDGSLAGPELHVAERDHGRRPGRPETPSWHPAV